MCLSVRLSLFLGLPVLFSTFVVNKVTYSFKQECLNTTDPRRTHVQLLHTDIHTDVRNRLIPASPTGGGAN